MEKVSKAKFLDHIKSFGVLNTHPYGDMFTGWTYETPKGEAVRYLYGKSAKNKGRTSYFICAPTQIPA